MTKRPRIHWTEEERQQIIASGITIRQTAPNFTWKTMIEQAQHVLPPSRRRTIHAWNNGAFGWFREAIERSDQAQPTPPPLNPALPNTEPNRPAEQHPLPESPSLRQALDVLLEALSAAISDAIAKGIREGLARQNPTPPRSELPTYKPRVTPEPEPKATPPKRPKIIVAGLRGTRATKLREEFTSLIDLTTVQVEKNKHGFPIGDADYIVLLSRFIGHKTVEYVNKHAPLTTNIHFVHQGGAEAVKKKLEDLWLHFHSQETQEPKA